jgi:ATP-dependent Lon protease
MEVVLKHALVRQPEAITWDEEAEEAAARTASKVEDTGEGMTAH